MNGIELAAAGGLGVLAVIDMRKKAIPVIPVIGIGFLLLVYRMMQEVSGIEILRALLPGALLLLLSVCSRGSIGSGDGLVLLVIGIVCGAQRTIVVLELALLLAFIVAIVLLAAKKASKKTEFPFLPCVFLGYILCFFI